MGKTIMKNLKVDLIKKIKDNTYLPGERLPSERELSAKYKINRMQVKQILEELSSGGYIYRRQGKGTFVQKRDLNKFDLGFLNESGNSGITAMVKSQGVKVSNKVLTQGYIAGNSYFARKLRQKKEDPIYVLHRIRYGNEEPIAIEYTYLKSRYFKDIEKIDFKEVSLYDYMDQKGHMPIIFDQIFRIMHPSVKEMNYLCLKRKQPVYYFEFIGMDDGGEIVEYTESITRVDKSEFKFTAKSST